jgi:hypothetical protein
MGSGVTLQQEKPAFLLLWTQLRRCSCSAFPLFVAGGYDSLGLQVKAINCISPCLCPFLIGVNPLPTKLDENH